MLLDRIIKKWRRGDAPRDVRVKRAPADPETTADLVDQPSLRIAPNCAQKLA